MSQPQILDAEEIRSLIAYRLWKFGKATNCFHRNHILGQVRALCAVLNKGVAPKNTCYAPDYLDAAGIPYEIDEENGKFFFDDEWLDSHGFRATDDGVMRHKKFKEW